MSVIIRMSDGTVFKAESGTAWTSSPDAPWLHVFAGNEVIGSFNVLEVDGIHLEDKFEVVVEDDDAG